MATRSESVGDTRFNLNQRFSSLRSAKNMQKVSIVLLMILIVSVLALFPLLLLGGINVIVSSMENIKAIDWVHTGIWSGIFLYSLFVMFLFAKAKFAGPQGIARLSLEKCPELKQEIEQSCSEKFMPRIHDVVITEEFELTIVRTPKSAFPFYCKHTLKIGLPTLILLCPEQFKMALVREFEKKSILNMRLNAWAVEFRNMIPQYLKAFRADKRWRFTPLPVCFSILETLFNRASIPFCQDHELDGDHLALRHVHYEDFYEYVQKETVLRKLLESQFWPKLKGSVFKGNLAVKPYQAMMEFFGPLDPRYCDQVLKLILKNEKEEVKSELQPRLQQRLDLMGAEKTIDFFPVRIPAGKRFFGMHFVAIITTCDRSWRQKTLPLWKAEKQRMYNGLKAINDLKKKAAARRLSIKEMLQFNKLNQEFGDKTTLPLKALLLGKIP